jgi:hypothetical protein
MVSDPAARPTEGLRSRAGDLRSGQVRGQETRAQRGREDPRTARKLADRSAMRQDLSEWV